MEVGDDVEDVSQLEIVSWRGKKRGDSVGSAYPFKDGKLMTIRKRVGRLNSSSSYIPLFDVFPQGSLCWLKEGRQPKIRGIVIWMFVYSIYMFIIFPIYVVTKLHSLCLYRSVLILYASTCHFMFCFSKKKKSSSTWNLWPFWWVGAPEWPTTTSPFFPQEYETFTELRLSDAVIPKVQVESSATGETLALGGPLKQDMKKIGPRN